jgi:hypothetical protein
MVEEARIDPEFDLMGPKEGMSQSKVAAMTNQRR